jgi:hypothetical protein
MVSPRRPSRFARAPRVPARLLGVVVAMFTTACGDPLVDPPLPPNPGEPSGALDVVAVAGPDLVVVEGARVALTGALSRTLAGTPTLSWSQLAGPAVTLSNPSSATPTFRAPLGPVRLVFALQAQVADAVDVDEVVVFVVDDPAAVVREPLVAAPPRDGLGDDAARFAVRWPVARPPRVDARCGTVGGVDVDVDADVATIALRPRAVPCLIVVDDAGDPASDETTLAARRVGRSVFALWPAATPRARRTSVAVDAVVAPGVEVVSDVDVDAVFTAVDGSVIDVVADADGAAFVAPRTAGRLTLVAEQRRAGTSGGAVVVPVDVAAAGNAPPRVRGGPDLRVAPGSRFRIAASATDDSVDDVAIAIDQVGGPVVARVSGFVDVLEAPAALSTGETTTLLFHVTADDGVWLSAPDPVRVVVDASAVNQPPELALPRTLYTTPGATFVIDARAAARDDAGLVESTEIVQDSADPVQLLAAPDTSGRVALVAGVDGERYRFRVSAYDAGGLGVTVDVDVVVEAAGPFVDAARGSAVGNGTALAPFASVAAAVETAARHGFTALLLAEGPQEVTGRLPDGLGLLGGHRFDAASGAYVVDETSGRTSLLVGAEGVVVVGASVSGLDVDGALRVEQECVVDDLSAAVALTVAAGARVVASQVVGAVSIESASFTCTSCALTRLDGSGADVVIDGGTVVALAANDGLLVVDGGAVVGSADALDPAVTAAGVSNVVLGAVDVVGAGDAIVVDGGTVSFGGTRVRATAHGVVVNDGVVRGVVDIAGDVGVVAPGGVVDLSDSVVDAVGLGVSGASVTLERVRVVAGDVGVDAVDVDLAAVVVDAIAVGVRAEAGAVRHATVRAASALDVAPGVLLQNSVLLGAAAGTLPEAPSHIGFAVEAAVDVDALGCVACVVVVDAAAVVDDTLHLVAGDNPFTDAGVDVGVALDIDGDAFDVAAPDLGADERVP